MKTIEIPYKDFVYLQNVERILQNVTDTMYDATLSDDGENLILPTKVCVNLVRNLYEFDPRTLDYVFDDLKRKQKGE